MLLSIITFIIVLGLLVFIHEFGHFTVAKLTGMRVDEFAIGFPPRLYGIKKGETTYALNAIPLGGYVRIHGENPEAPVDHDVRSFNARPILARIAVIVAGVIMNVLLAFVVLTVAFSVGFSSISQDLTQVPGNHVKKNEVLVAEVLPSTAAAKAGLQPGDQFVSVSGQAVTTAQSLQAITKEHQAESKLPVTVTVLRSGSDITVPAKLAATGTALGVALDEEQVVSVPFYRAPLVAAKEIGSILGLTWTALGQFADKLFVHGKLDQDVSGPVGIYQATATAVHTGFASVVFLLVALSLNLALMNILPIPALDGGKLFFLLLEAIFRKRVVAEHIENIVNATGFVLIMLLIVVLSVRDLIHL